MRIMQVRKRFGQHFLHDPGVIRRIVEAIAPADGERLVERLTGGRCEGRSMAGGAAGKSDVARCRRRRSDVGWA